MRPRRPGKAWGCLVVLCLLLLAAMPGTASAASWRTHKLGGEAAAAQFFGVSCPSTSLRVAVGGNNTIASSTHPTDPAPWKVVYPEEGVVPGSPNQRRDQGDLLSLDRTVCRGHLPRQDPLDHRTDRRRPGLAHRGPRPERPEHPLLRRTPVRPPASASRSRAAARSPSPPTRPAGRRPGRSPTSPRHSNYVRCPAPHPRSASRSATAAPGSGPRPPTWPRWSVRPPPSPASGSRRSWAARTAASSASPVRRRRSASPVTCSATWSPRRTRPARPRPGAPLPPTRPCRPPGPPVARRPCAFLSDDNGDTLTATEPLAGGGAWTVQSLIPYTEPLIPNALFGVACSSPTFCALGATGEVLTSTAPAVLSTAPTPPPGDGNSTGKGKGKAKHKVRPKRPRVVLDFPARPRSSNPAARPSSSSASTSPGSSRCAATSAPSTGAEMHRRPALPLRLAAPRRRPPRLPGPRGRVDGTVGEARPGPGSGLPSLGGAGELHPAPAAAKRPPRAVPYGARSAIRNSGTGCGAQ